MRISAAFNSFIVAMYPPSLLAALCGQRGVDTDASLRYRQQLQWC
jgi:hypothetical protein